jgi:3-deoxy-D-manno-octulosonic-acid transferase
MGSIRKQEEESISWIMRRLVQDHTNISIGLFPRHMERISAWQRRLSKHKVPWVLRSQCQSSKLPRGIVLWDRFGELASAYRTAQVAFIGGSLAPLGGQNFLEPLVHGIVPIIGPSWSNFYWVGNEIIDQQLVRIAVNKQMVLENIRQLLVDPPDRTEVSKAASRYIRARQGGRKRACDLIIESLYRS